MRKDLDWDQDITTAYLHWRGLWRCHPTPGWWRWGRWKSAEISCLSWAVFPQNPAGCGVCSILACRGPRPDRARPETAGANRNDTDTLLTFRRWISLDIVIECALTSSRSKRMNSRPETSVRKSVRWSWLQTSAFLAEKKISCHRQTLTTKIPELIHLFSSISTTISTC